MDEELISQNPESIQIINQNPSARCICTHRIIENCQIKNQLNGMKIFVGNCCLQHLSQDHYQKIKKIVDCIKKITPNVSDEKHKLNAETIQSYHRLGIITEKDVKFLDQIKRKRQSLTAKQSEYMKDLKIKILISYFNKQRKPLEQAGIQINQCLECQREMYLSIEKKWKKMCYQCYQKKSF
jgi:hypothetical protein